MKVHTIDDFTVYTKDFKEKKSFKALLRKIDWPIVAIVTTAFALGGSIMGMIISVGMNWN